MISYHSVPSSKVACQLKVLRACGRYLLPADTRMPLRQWRWLWLALVFRLTVGLALFLAFVAPYVLFQWAIDGINWLGTQVGSVYGRCYRADLKRSGWKEPARRSRARLVVNHDGKRSA